MNATETKVLQKLRKDLEREGFQLAPGWRVAIETRKSGATKGGTDKYYFSPDGRKLRSKTEVMRFLGNGMMMKNGRGRRVASKENAKMDDGSEKKRTEKKRKKKALGNATNARGDDGSNFKNQEQKKQKKRGGGGGDETTDNTNHHRDHQKLQFQQFPAPMNITGMEDDDELDDDLSPQVLQQSQDSEQFCELNSFVTGLLEAPRTQATTATKSRNSENNDNLEGLSEEQMMSQYFQLTGFEPKYADVFELRRMLARERGGDRNASGGKHDTVLNRTASGELKLQRSLVFETADAKFANAMSAVPKYLGNTTYGSSGDDRSPYARDASPIPYPMTMTTTPLTTTMMHQELQQYPIENSHQQQNQDPTSSFIMQHVTGSRLQQKNSQALVVGVSKSFDPLDQTTVNEVYRALSLQNEDAKVFISQRDDELRQITTIVEGCLRDHRSGSIYVGGLPGTGKSLTLGAVEKTVKKWSSSASGVAKSRPPKVCSINCMAIQGKPTSVFKRICEQLDIVPTEEDQARGQAECSDMYEVCAEIAALRRFMSGGKVSGESERYMCDNDENDEDNKMMTNSNNGIDHRLAMMNAVVPHKAEHHSSMVIVLLDEIDQLEYRDAAILYELFALPSLPNSRCILVGVSNAMNLTDKALPRLRARGCEPSLIRFTAYTCVQLKRLLCERVQKYDAFELNALELCARKVSAQTGDMRKALRVCNEALQLCVDEARHRHESIERENCVVLDGEVIEGPALATLPPIDKIKVSHMARAISKIFQNPVVETIRALPQQQQMILCSCVRVFGTRTDFNKTAKEITLRELLASYTSACKEARIREMVPSDFSTACDRLADAQLLRIKGGSEEYARRVSMLVQRDDVVFSLQGVRFFANLLGGGNA